MHDPTQDTAANLRWGVYLILIALSTGAMLGRVMAVNSVDRISLEKHLKSQERPDWQQQRPFLSANDRSRWLTVRALVEHGTYAIDEVIQEPNWDTIDMVKHDGRLYSSKPPLFPTMMAGEYWLIHKLTGKTLGTHPYEIGRFMVVTINVIPLVVYFLLLAHMAERLGTTDWGRIFMMAGATGATFLSTFAVVINNHVIATVSVAAAVAAAVTIWCDGERRWRYFAVAGLFAAFAAANELPALAFFGLISLALLWRAPLQTLLFYVPASLLVVAGFFGTNYIAHGTLIPPYAHRQDGKVLFTTEGIAPSDLETESLPQTLRDEFEEHRIPLSSDVELRTDTATPGWVITDQETNRQFAVRADGDRLAIREWDNWYDYFYERGGKVRESYWRTTSARSIVDQGEASRGLYIFNVLLGHHGIFSLTPIWLLTLMGIFLAWRSPKAGMRELAAMTAVLTAVCLAFYLSREQIDRNYGGSTSGLRWMFWFAPLWLVTLLPAADWASERRWSRATSLVLLALAALSASYPTWNPWTHPWLMYLFQYFGWAQI